MPINLINKASWNKHAERYQQNANFSYDTVDFGDVRCLNDDDLNLIGEVNGLDILELGCGGANCGIALAKKGARMTCIDISEKQIEFAKQYAQREKVRIDFFVSPIEQIGFLNQKRFDKIISIATLMYVKELKTVFQQAYHLLKPGGEFIFSMDNPIFYAVAMKTGLFPNDRTSDSYFYSGEEIWKWLMKMNSIL